MRLFARWTLVFVVLAAGVFAPQNSAGRAGAPSPDSAGPQLEHFLSSPLPGHVTAEEPPSLYKPDTLFQYIDGGADIYLLYDFQVLLHQDFKSGATELTVDVYDMQNPDDAFGVYAAERSPSYKFAAIGIEAYRSKGILNFVQDHYYVKLSGSGANADLLLDQFAHTLSQRIAGVRMLPSLLRKLPAEHRVPHSEQYVRKDPLGHSFLSPAYVVTYSLEGKESKLLISVAGDSAAAKARLQQFAAHFKQSGESLPAPELGTDGIRAKNSFEGRVIARTQGRYLIVMLNPAPNGPEILKVVAQSLP